MEKQNVGQNFTKLLIVIGLLSLSGCAEAIDTNKQVIEVNNKAVSIPKSEEQNPPEVVVEKVVVPEIKKSIPVEAKKDDSVRVYQAKGSYVSPAAVENLNVKVSLKNEMVESLEMVSDSSSPKSLRFQGLFLEGVRKEIIGKKISEIGQFTRVNGSSLTGSGFNQAIAIIKSEAAK